MSDDDILKLIRTLDEAEVPAGNRYMHVHPWMAEAAIAAGLLIATDQPNVFEVNMDAFK